VKHKDKKSGKRGPKGAQSPNWVMPYQPSSILHKAFELCSKKGGAKVKDLTHMVKKLGGKPQWVIKIIKSGRSLGWVWEVDDSYDRIRVTRWHYTGKKK
jgi:hypothetical protein